ncbi:MAG: anthranilate phosphoribosyltransferase [bacterium]|nr:anthranilate phosphoribosyltransferase [bacterium]
MDITEAISKITQRRDLSVEESFDVMSQIMRGNALPSQIAGYLIALKMKGESIDEITGSAMAMRKEAKKIKVKGDLIDTCGTGGDEANTFNISTGTAFVVAGAGIKVAKHGNKAVSSKCGSADVLLQTGVNINIEEEKAAKCIEEIGIGFLFAPSFHPAMRFAIGPRKELKTRTIFNILGPMTNPASAEYQLVGVFDRQYTRILAEVLKKLGARRAMVVHGMDGIDEITTTAKTFVSELKDGEVKDYEITPETFGFKKVSVSDIRGGDAEYNKDILLSVLKGEKSAFRDIILLNAGVAVMCAGKEESMEESLSAAAESIDSGRAYGKLKALIEFTNG